MSKNSDNHVSRSPERNTFQAQSHIKKLEEDPTDENAAAMVKLYEQWAQNDLDRVDDPKWQKDNMEYDLRSTKWICDKVKESDVYAQNLYAAMCNRDFMKLAVMPILKDQKWSCSWRHAGGIIADMREKGDYIDWYCSGIINSEEMDPIEFSNLTEEQQIQYKEGQAYVSEAVVTHEIEQDLKKLGWAVLPDDADTLI